jgi:hypothetical protein
MTREEKIRRELYLTLQLGRGQEGKPLHLVMVFLWGEKGCEAREEGTASPTPPSPVWLCLPLTHSCSCHCH